MKIFRIIGNEGRITIPYAIRQAVGFLPDDVVSFQLMEDDSVLVRREALRGKEKIPPGSGRDDDLEILDQYNSEIRGFRNYYGIANNSAYANSFGYIMRYSMYKTFATKYRVSMSKIIRRYQIGKEFGVRFTDKKGKEKVRLFYNEGFARKPAQKIASIDSVPSTVKYSSKTSLMARLSARQCELCGKTDCEIEMHHVRKLKDLKEKTYWERLMIARNRKTLALCKDCHNKLHAGKLD